MPRTTDDVLPAGHLASMEQPTLADDRVELRPWRTNDRAAVTAAFTDPDIEHWHLRRLTTDAEAVDWIATRHHSWQDESGGGVATHALRTLAGWGFDEAGFHRLWLMHSTANPPSCAVARAAGFEARAPCGRPCSTLPAGTTCTSTAASGTPRTSPS